MPFKRILVIEDYAPFRQHIRLSLQQITEFQISEASDGLEAVQKAKEVQPDLVLIDIGLPKLNGIEAARQIRRLAPDAKLLFVSQESHPDVVKETFRLGGHGYVHKALAMTDLLPAIQTVLGGGRFVSSSLEFQDVAETRGRHEVQFYSDDSGFLKGCARFVAEALSAADAAVVVATEAHRQGLVQRLRSDGFDIDRGIEKGTCVLLDAVNAVSAAMVDGVPDAVRFSSNFLGLIESTGKIVRKEHPRVAIFGECGGLLCADGNPDAAIALEKIGNDLFKAHNVDILCAYPFHGRKDDIVIKSICEEHTAVHWH